MGKVDRGLLATPFKPAITMFSFLFQPLLSWLVRQLLAMVVRALGRDLRQRLPEVFKIIDQQIIPAMQRGASAVAMTFFTAVQRVVKRDPTDMELRILQLLFDPSIAAEHQQPTTTADQ